jgi:hypothetical protein
MWIDGPMSWQEQLASGISFPAAFSPLLLIPFESQFPSGAVRELASHAIMAICVPFLWYVVGRSIDVRRMNATNATSSVMRAIAAASFAALLVFAVLDVASLALGAVGMAILQILVLVWIGCGMWAIRKWFRFHRRVSLVS